MSSDHALSPLETGVLARINEARADHLVRTGEDYLWADLMRAVGWSQTVTSQVKTAKRPVQLSELPAVAKALGVRVEWLAFGSGPMRATAGGAGRGTLPEEPEEVLAVRPLAAPAKRRRAR